MKEEFCFGCKELMSKKLTQVTKWLPNSSSLEFATNQLAKGNIVYLVKRKQANSWEETDWKYALFRKYIAPL